MGLRRWLGLSQRNSAVNKRRKLERATRNRHSAKAHFIAVTGSSTKTTTTALIAHVLQRVGSVRTQLISNGRGGLVKLLQQPLADVHCVVAEVGVSGPDQMKELAEILQPDVAVVTMIGLEHYTAFRSKEAVAAEKSHLVRALRAGGLAILNADDSQALAMANCTTAKVITFGRSEEADCRILVTEADEQGCLHAVLAGDCWRLEISTQLVGEHFAIPVAAAVACLRELGVPHNEIAAGIRSFGGIRGRMEVFRTSGPTFILDTNKAPLGTLRLAFEALRKVQAQRKWIVLGQISDYPGNPNPKYRDAYKAAREIADHVIYVGEHAHRSKASDQDRASGRFAEFFTTQLAYEHLRKHAVPGDAILLKSSSVLHLERIALAWENEVQCWAPRCGKAMDCRMCGLYMHPFDQHATIRKRQRKRQRWSWLLPQRRPYKGRDAAISTGASLGIPEKVAVMVCPVSADAVSRSAAV